VKHVTKDRSAGRMTMIVVEVALRRSVGAEERKILGVRKW
jgi:hypothetical protein